MFLVSRNGNNIIIWSWNNPTENPKVNSILEKIHQFIANLVRTVDVQNKYLDKDDPWLGILAVTYFAI